MVGVEVGKVAVGLGGDVLRLGDIELVDRSRQVPLEHRQVPEVLMRRRCEV